MIETTPVHVLSVNVEPLTDADWEALVTALARLMEEDPTLGLRIDPAGQASIFGIGERHLEIVIDRLRSEFQVEARASGPHVAYKEALTIPSQGEGRFVKETGGGLQYAHVELRLEPGERGAGYVFRSLIVGDAIPERFIAPVDDGIRGAVGRGVLAGYPIDDVRIELVDGSWHETDSSEAAFRIAGAMAFRDAALKASPVLLEPVMRVEVATPSDFVTELLQDLVSRRADILSDEVRFMTGAIQARVPMATMLGYATSLRDLSRGRASYTIQFDRYQPVRR